MSWYTLVLAGLFEIGWAIGLEYSDGLSKPVPTVATGIALVISMVLLARAVEDLPIGTAYAVWTGIGAVGTASLGIVLFDEPATLLRLGFVGLIVVGIVGLGAGAGGVFLGTGFRLVVPGIGLDGVSLDIRFWRVVLNTRSGRVVLGVGQEEIFERRLLGGEVGHRHAAGLQFPERRHEVDAVRARGDDFGTRVVESVPPVVVDGLGHEHVRRRGVVQYPGVEWGPTGRIGDDAGGVAGSAVAEALDAAVGLVECEVWVVSEDGADADHHRVGGGPQAVDTVEVLGTAYPDLHALPRRELSVGARRRVHDHVHVRRCSAADIPLSVARKRFL